MVIIIFFSVKVIGAWRMAPLTATPDVKLPILDEIIRKTVLK